MFRETETVEIIEDFSLARRVDCICGMNRPTAAAADRRTPEIQSMTIINPSVLAHAMETDSGDSVLYRELSGTDVALSLAIARLHSNPRKVLRDAYPSFAFDTDHEFLGL